jgi:hypothetical protein
MRGTQKSWKNSKERNMKKAYSYLALILFLSLVGCDRNVFDSVSDDSSSEADIEAAQMALDDGNYQEAIDILEPGYDESAPDQRISRILASAYMGKAGIDLTYILENAPDENSDSFDVIASALSLHIVNDSLRAGSEQTDGESESSGSPRYVAYDSAEAFLENLESAKAYLETLVELYGNDDDKVQLGMASAIHFILEIGCQAATLKGTNIPINREAYQEVFPVDAGWEGLLSQLADSIPPDGETALSLQEDVTCVSDAVTVLMSRMGSDEDIAADFSEFLTDLLGGSEIGDFEGQEIADYIGAHLLGYAG